jgi:hypothetical protein
MRRRSGWIFADVVMSLALLSMAAGTLAVAVNRHHAASQKLSDLRTASRVAESAMTALQSGQPAPAGMVRVQSLESADSPAGRWVRVIAIDGKESASVVGMIPKGPS